MTRFTDNTVMPFGKHKGRLLKDVPPDYLLWLYDKMRIDEKPGGIKMKLMAYVAANRECLEKEVSGEL